MADTVTYYFDGYDVDGEEWTNLPENMVDGNTVQPAHTGAPNQVQLCNSNTCPGTDLGTITKVEIRCYAHHTYDGHELRLRPVLAGGDGDDHDFAIPVWVGDWCAYQDITSDTNAPSPWTWAAVQGLDVDIVAIDGKGYPYYWDEYCSKVEIRVTYSIAGGGGGGALAQAAARLLLG